MSFTREELTAMEYRCPACLSAELEYNGDESMACPHCGFVTEEAAGSDLEYGDGTYWEGM